MVGDICASNKQMSFEFGSRPSQSRRSFGLCGSEALQHLASMFGVVPVFQPDIWLPRIGDMGKAQAGFEAKLEVIPMSAAHQCETSFSQARHTCFSRPKDRMPCHDRQAVFQGRCCEYQIWLVQNQSLLLVPGELTYFPMQGGTTGTTHLGAGPDGCGFLRCPVGGGLGVGIYPILKKLDIRVLSSFLGEPHKPEQVKVSDDPSLK